MEATKAGVHTASIVGPGSETGSQSATQWRVFLFGPNPNRTLCRVLVWGVLLIGCFHHLLLPIQIIGSSMTPTYQNGSLNFVNRWSYAAKPPTRGDVVALETEGELLLKRIVGLPGETVSIEAGRLRVNGGILLDPFSRFIIPWEMEPLQLGPNEYFVIGDNRSASVFCKIDKKHILGKTVF